MRYIQPIVLAASLTLISTVCRADCEPSAYAFDNLVVFHACGNGDAPQLNVIVLEDSSALRVSGRAKSAITRGIDTYAHYENQLILLSWDTIEIYDLKNPAMPAKVATFELKHQPSVPGWPKIEKLGADKFLLLSTIGAAELTAQDGGRRWKLSDVERTRDEAKRMEKPPPEEELGRETSEPAVVRESARFRYELVPKDDTKVEGEVIHRKYLRKIDGLNKRVVSELLLFETVETID